MSADDVMDLYIHGLMQLHEPKYPPPAAVEAIWRFSPEGSAMRCLMMGFLLWHIQQISRSKSKSGGQDPRRESEVVKLLRKNEGLMRAVMEEQKDAEEKGGEFEFPLMGMWESPCEWHVHTVAGMEYDCPVQKRRMDLEKEVERKKGTS
ncbi:hypothetical protein IFR05_012453 [Cadophora sp. M221]|nr:hypothetical protein IFR05_012453 [Cadophora sp. M221]